MSNLYVLIHKRYGFELDTEVLTYSMLEDRAKRMDGIPLGDNMSYEDVIGCFQDDDFELYKITDCVRL